MIRKSIFIILFIVNIFCNAYSKTIELKTNNSLQIDIINEYIPTNSYFKYQISNAGNYSFIDFSDFTVTTANIMFVNSNGLVVSSSNLISGNPLNINGYARVNILIRSNSSPITLNGNIRLWDDLNVSGNYSITVSTSNKVLDPLIAYIHSNNIFTKTQTVPTLTITTFSSNPTIYADSDTDTGIQFSGPDIISLKAGGETLILGNSSSVLILGATDNITVLHDGDVTIGQISSSNTVFENNTGFMIATNNAMAWDDVAYQSFFSAKPSGVGSLSLITITGNLQAYTMSVNDYVPFSVEMLHKWKLGTKTSHHIHILTTAKDADDRYVKYTYEYSYIDINGSISAPLTVSTNYLIPANTPKNTHLYVELLDSGSTLLSVVSGHVLSRVTRVTATGTAPSADPAVLSYGIHGYVDSLGSRKEYAK